MLFVAVVVVDAGLKAFFDLTLSYGWCFSREDRSCLLALTDWRAMKLLSTKDGCKPEAFLSKDLLVDLGGDPESRD